MKKDNKIYIIKGKDIIKMTMDILNLMNPLEGRSKDILIGIKPNLVCVSRASEGATTHPEIVEGIIQYLKQSGYDNIIVLESSWVGANTEDAADYCGYTELCRKHDIPFINIKQTDSTEHNVGGLKVQVSKYVEKLDYLINVPLIKGHCQTGITCALKNMKGLIPDAEKRRYHTLGLHKPIAYLNTVIKQDLIIADAICPDPYFEEGGRPKQMDMIAGAFDPVLMDCYAAEVLGYEPFDIKYIKLAWELGVGKIKDDDTEIIKIGDIKDTEKVQQKEKKYLKLVLEDNACSACYSSLVTAMERLNAEGLTEKLVDEISIGQGYRGAGGTVGIGDCTAGFERNIAGCPPKSEDIYNFLRAIAESNESGEP
ncbi:MAG: DUF362 domain-containing protein [Clostridia bacterium]|nr:DUF362 domain-containing protein [Clostridia bacterium]